MSRITKVQKLLELNQSLLVSNPTNIRYLSGFTGSNSLLFVNQEQRVLITDSRYVLQSKAEAPDFDIVIAPDIWIKILEFVKTEQLKIEANNLTVSRLAQLQSALPNVQIVHTTSLIENLRLIKDQDELTKISQACQIATTALNSLISKSVSGKSELELAIELERSMVDLGAETIAFSTIVATGSNSAIPHHQPTSRIVANGDLLKIDFGAQYQGYKSDCTRTFVIGSASDWQLEIHQAVLAGQSQGRNICKPGLGMADLDSQVRKQIDQAGYAQFFTHGLGHGVGLDIHEDPFLSAKTHGSIASNMVITIEPGIYLAEQGGVRIEDTGVVTETGYKVLTEFEYELLELT